MRAATGANGDETAGTVTASTLVSDLLPIVVAQERRVAVVDGDGRVCGTVDRLIVLRALAEDV